MYLSLICFPFLVFIILLIFDQEVPYFSINDKIKLSSSFFQLPLYISGLILLYLLKHWSGLLLWKFDAISFHFLPLWDFTNFINSSSSSFVHFFWFITFLILKIFGLDDFFSIICFYYIFFLKKNSLFFKYLP